MQADGRVDVTCGFCNRHYHFDQIDLAQLFHDGGTAAADTRRGTDTAPPTQARWDSRRCRSSGRPAQGSRREPWPEFAAQGGQRGELRFGLDALGDHLHAEQTGQGLDGAPGAGAAVVVGPQLGHEERSIFRACKGGTGAGRTTRNSRYRSRPARRSHHACAGSPGSASPGPGFPAGHARSPRCGCAPGRRRGGQDGEQLAVEVALAPEVAARTD